MTLHGSPAFDRPAPRRSGQLELTDLGTQLFDVPFVIVDLETTGGLRGRDEITEIGAVRVRGGESSGEFSTLVRPAEAVIAPFVERLTGITNAMVRSAPPLEAVLPQFLEFSRGCVLVAHNAPFDIGFLRAACSRLDYPWPDPVVLDTVRMARQVVSREEIRNHKLGTLATFFGTTIEPTHRALDDARATAEIMHRLFERYGSAGVTTLEELRSLKPAGYKRRAAKRHLAVGVPHSPGVYMFVDGSERVLYVGTSRDMHTRVNNYFAAGETRGRMAEMVTAAQRVATVVCDTSVEAAVREVRLIAELAPPYNRRSKHPERLTWLRLTDETFPRLSVTRKEPALGEFRLGPFRGAKPATAAKELAERLFPLKRCTQRYGASFRPCPAGEIGACAGPCAGDADPQTYRSELSGLRELADGAPAEFQSLLNQRLARLAGEQRYESAAATRDAGAELLQACAGAESRAALRRVSELAAAKPDERGGWDVAVVRHGRLAASVRTASQAALSQAARTAALTAEYVGADTSTLNEETDLLVRWLGDDGVVPVMETEPGWSLPVSGAVAARSHSPLVSGHRDALRGIDESV